MSSYLICVAHIVHRSKFRCLNFEVKLLMMVLEWQNPELNNGMDGRPYTIKIFIS